MKEYRSGPDSSGRGSRGPALRTESNLNFGVFPFGDFEVDNSTEDDNERCGLECQAKKEIRARNVTGEDKNDSIRETFSQKVIFLMIFT